MIPAGALLAPELDVFKTFNARCSNMAADKSDPSNDKPPAILAVTAHGVDLALRIQAGLQPSVCYVPRRHRFAIAMGAVPFDRLAAVFPQVWRKHSALICIMATGIVVRLIAPLARHKTEDPAVVVLDERGNFVISLLSGHLGGANDLAARVAGITGGQPVITTATDVQGKPALDLMAREKGLEIENIAVLRRVARAILEEDPVWIHDPENRLAPDLEGVQGIRTWEEGAESSENADDPSVGVWVSEADPQAGFEWLILRPRNLVVGLGCNRGTSSVEILGLIHRVFQEEKLSPLSIRNLASVDLKADEPGLLEAAGELKQSIEFFSRRELEGVDVPNPSLQVEAHIGVRSVCEAAAIRSASNGHLVVSKRKTANVTLAVSVVPYRR
ncbi:MAG: cobalt-precorrin 5A hydrolase [Syntrophobacteraceae bacterium]